MSNNVFEDSLFHAEIEFCQFIQFLYIDEPVWIQFKINHAYITFFVYCNDETFAVFEDFSLEMNSNLEDYGLIDNGWEKFYVREVSVPEDINEYNKRWEFVSMNANVVDLEKNLIQ